VNATRKVAVWPGEIDGVFLPAMRNAWEALPLFVTVKITVPVGTLRLDSVHLKSVAATVTREVPV
jgi:hypothetical protein